MPRSGAGRVGVCHGTEPTHDRADPGDAPSRLQARVIPGLEDRPDLHTPRIMSRFRPRDSLDRVFEVGVILKGLDGLLEAVGGLLLLAVTPAAIDRVMVRLTQHELSEDPNDVIVRRLL